MCDSIRLLCLQESRRSHSWHPCRSLDSTHSNKSREALCTSTSTKNTIIWTHQLSRSCLDSCLRIGLVAPIPRCRFEYRMGVVRRPDAFLARGAEPQRRVEVIATGSRERISSHMICQRSTPGIRWLRQMS